jgi:type VI protein secretion system component Hcp
MSEPSGARLSKLGVAIAIAAILFIAGSSWAQEMKMPMQPRTAVHGSFQAGALAGGRQIEVLSWSWGPAHRAIVITKEMDAASPILYRACASGQHFPRMTVNLGGREYVLSNAVLGSYRKFQRGRTPMESISLNFTKMTPVK